MGHLTDVKGIFLLGFLPFTLSADSRCLLNEFCHRSTRIVHASFLIKSIAGLSWNSFLMDPHGPPDLGAQI